MHLPERLRARISALGELSRPLGERRAATLARTLAEAVARDLALGRDASATIDNWIRKIALEIAATCHPPAREAAAKSRSGARRLSLADVLPEVH